MLLVPDPVVGARLTAALVGTAALLVPDLLARTLLGPKTEYKALKAFRVFLEPRVLWALKVFKALKVCRVLKGQPVKIVIVLVGAVLVPYHI